ncbi:unnamed protein product [Rhizophagus irregularis]|nr:unnamed protein product [Rhizophagus irregularis]
MRISTAENNISEQTELHCAFAKKPTVTLPILNLITRRNIPIYLDQLDCLKFLKSDVANPIFEPMNLDYCVVERPLGPSKK